MKKLKIIIFIFLLVIILPNQVQLQDIPQTNDKELVAESGQVSVKVTVSSFLESRCCKAPSSWRWGSSNYCPRTFVSDWEVKVNGKSVFIPLSAFCDLGDPLSVQIEARAAKSSFAVVLIGGDAGFSYSATLEFTNNLLSVRLVQHGEFPRKAWEKTIYKFNVE